MYPKKIQDSNLGVFNMVTETNGSKRLTKDISCECECEIDAWKYNSNHRWNNDKCWFACKKHYIFKNDYIWNPATCSCKKWKNLASILDDLIIICDEVINSYDEEIKTIPVNCNEQKATSKTLYLKCCILLTF